MLIFITLNVIRVIVFSVFLFGKQTNVGFQDLEVITDGYILLSFWIRENQNDNH